MKALRTGLIKVSILQFDSYFWFVKNSSDFGISSITTENNFPSEAKAKANFERIAKLNGWKNYTWVWA